MKILVIGGTQFVGRHFVRQAIVRGHEVTLFNRGNQAAPDGVAGVIERDRNSDIEKVSGGEWDAVLDTCGYFPRQLRDSCNALAERANHYTFISTISVYRDQHIPHQGETAPTIELEDPDVEEIRGDTYGGLKVLCEKAIDQYFPGKRLIIRPGLIVGPYDPTDRFTYWPVRMARGGEVLVPGSPDMPVQWIDVRDLAAWSLDAIESSLTGTYNAVCEPDRFNLGELLQISREVSNSQCTLTWVDEQFLLDNGVQPFSELPLWIPGDHVNFSRIDSSSAQRQGLKARGIDETVAATLQWYDTLPEDRQMRAGIDAEKEKRLLEQWHAR